MTNDLRHVLEGFSAAESRASEIAPVELTTEVRALTGRVRRRRAGRTAAAGVAALAVVAALAAGVQAVGRTDAGPAETVPAPTSTPWTAPAYGEVIGDVTTHPDLPPAEPLRAGVFEASDASWAMLTVTVHGPPGSDAPGWVLYLVDPDGTRYEVPSAVPLVDTNSAPVHGPVQDWLPGTSLVSMALDPVDWATQPGRRVVLDVLTGERFLDVPVSAVPSDSGGPYLRFAKDGTTDVLRTDASQEPTDHPTADGMPVELVVSDVTRLTKEGVEVARLGTGFSTRSRINGYDVMSLAPGGAHLVVPTEDGTRLVRSADLSTVATLAPEGQDARACEPRSWWDESRVVLACDTDVAEGAEIGYRGPDVSLWLVPIDGGDAARLPDVAEESYLPGLSFDGAQLLVTEEDGFLLLGADGEVTRVPWTPADDQYLAGRIGRRLLVEGAGEGRTTGGVLVDPWTGAETPWSGGASAAAASVQLVGRY
ncbi:hypothetical protein [Cellulomonas cellasea]|uniref:Uncharacterized protein n=1 Tax=Cellulomonas cellasea TaxID=43670 RepID=A0A7W4UHS1_9CELL|nr:hypothetical protein [Cellulomonas cellasea]MBB2924388.1 hypothetical protein [Cellulomonas cellasea]